MSDVQQSVKDTFDALAPEDVVVVYDAVEVQTKDLGGAKADYAELLKTIAGMSATSLKSNPSILGMRIGGSQSMGNTESQIYLRISKAIQRPVADVLSRAFTLAVRLYGVDAYAKAVFNPIDLRPESELEAFRTMREERILRRLSLGLITDEQAAFELGLPFNPSAPPLSGTRFMDSPGNVQADPQDAPLQGDTLGRSLQPDAPRRAGGRSQ